MKPITYLPLEIKTNKKRMIWAFAITLLLIACAFFINYFFPINFWYYTALGISFLLIFFSLLLDIKTSGITYYLQLIFTFLLVITLTYISFEVFLANNLAIPFDGEKMMYVREIINFIIIFFLLTLVISLFSNIRLGILIFLTLSLLLGIICYTIFIFRGDILLPGDITALFTALSVADSYQFEFNENFFVAIIIFLALFLITLKLPIRKIKFTRPILFCFSLLFFYFFSLYPFENYYYPWFIPNNGYLFSVAINAKLLKVNEPEDYDTEELEEYILNLDKKKFTNEDMKSVIARQFPSFKTANIICIQNESFTDLSSLGDFKTDLSLMNTINNLDNKIAGDLVSEVYGGGTCDTEFSFLTGLSTKLFSANARVYQHYINEETHSLINELQKDGYQTIALHPDNPENWNRKQVFEQLDLDHFYSAEDFNNSEKIRELFISDLATYEKVIDLFNQKGKNPLFIYDITVQNHGGYNLNYDKLEKVNILNSNGLFPKTEQFLSLVRLSDQEILPLINYFKEYPEPVLIVFYGDHQPKLDQAFYDSLGVKKTDRNVMLTDFFIWANYDLPEIPINQMSIIYLSSLVKELSGISPTPINNFLTNLYFKYPVLDKTGVITSEGESVSYDSLDSKDLKIYDSLIYNQIIDKNQLTSLQIER